MYSITELNTNPIFTPPDFLLNPVYNFFEIDCDDLDFPNLTTINSLPNEILEIIKLQKDKLEINDYYDKTVKYIENQYTDNAITLLKSIKNMKGLTLKKARRQENGGLDFLLDNLVEFYNNKVYIYDNRVKGWDTKNFSFKTIKSQRDQIIDLCIDFFKDFEMLLEYCDFSQSYFIMKSSNISFENAYHPYPPFGFKENLNMKKKVDNNFLRKVSRYTENNDILYDYAKNIMDSNDYY